MTKLALVDHKINHVALVIDRSGSIAISRLTDSVIKVVDAQVAWLAKLAKDTGQETRISVYTFYRHQVECIAFDIDASHLPSLRGHYSPDGGTPMISGTLQAIADLEKTAQMYGDHGFLVFVVTDGEENSSHVTQPVGTPAILTRKLSSLPENWTVGVLVPDFNCKIRAEGCGFPKGNIAIWDTSGQHGVEEMGEEIKAATGSYFHSRASGVRGTNTLFSGLTVNNVTQAQVAATNLKPVSTDDFMIVPVALASTSTLPIKIPTKSVTRKNPDGIKHVEIQPFVEETGRKYITGNVYYELVKSEKYENGKGVVLVHRKTREVFRGSECKALIGLTGTSTRVRPQPDKGGEYDIFIQSTSNNRYLPIGSRVLIFK